MGGSSVAKALSLALLLLGVAPLPGAALSIEVSPLILEIGRETPSVVVTVRNGGTAPIRCEVSAMAWTESAAGEVSLSPSKDVSVYPPLFQLSPGAERKIRIGATVPPASVERAWRIFIEEVPSAVEPVPGKATLQFRTRMALPLFQTPILPEPRSAVTLERVEGKLLLRVKNDGNVHFRPDLISLSTLGADQRPVFEAEVPTWTVLPGRSALRELPTVPKEKCGSVRAATVVAVTRQGPVQATLPLPDGACGP